MNKNEILQFLNENPIFHLATIEAGKPRVRGMMLYRADDNGIVFNTGKVKDLYRQLMENPEVEMSFTNGSFDNLTQVRVSGKVELVEDLDLKKEIVSKREFLKPWVEKAGYEAMAVFRLAKGVATTWTFATNLTPKEYVQL